MWLIKVDWIDLKHFKHTDSKYSAALSALWKLAFKARRTWSRVYPRDINSVTELSKAVPVRRPDSAGCSLRPAESVSIVPLKNNLYKKLTTNYQTFYKT